MASQLPPSDALAIVTTSCKMFLPEFPALLKLSVLPQERVVRRLEHLYKHRYFSPKRRQRYPGNPGNPGAGNAIGILVYLSWRSLGEVCEGVSSSVFCNGGFSHRFVVVSSADCLACLGLVWVSRRHEKGSQMVRKEMCGASTVV